MKPTQRVTSACFPAQLQAAFPVINFPFCCLGKFGETHCQQNLGRDPPRLPSSTDGEGLCTTSVPTCHPHGRNHHVQMIKRVFFPLCTLPWALTASGRATPHSRLSCTPPSHKPAKFIITKGVAVNPQAVSTLSVCPSLGLISNRQVI